MRKAWNKRAFLIKQTRSLEAVVHHFHPSYSAQTGGNVVAPSIVGSNVGNINISIFSTGQGSIVSSEEALNHDVKDSCGALRAQNDRIAQCQQKLKAALKRRFSHLLEGMTTEANRISLNQIYTELYITEGGSGGVNKEHEVRQIETTSRMHVAQDKSIHCNHLFVPPRGRDYHIRTVITRGVAGIGKTVSVSKFTLDWAEERENTHLKFVFPLSFRELNLMRKKTFSLVELLAVFFPETKDTGIFANGESKMLFILDGLDESRLSLDFNKSEIMCDVTRETTVAVLLTNLIRGRLLPCALVWITSRPVASGQIPLEYIDLVTEVRGFNNPQKDEYFRRKISDESLANRVIAHVKSCRSLHIMCHIPVFCWMAASVLEKKLATTDSEDTPKTLTQMYIHFLSLYVDNMKKRLPGRRESNADCLRTNLISLGELAFRELEKGHLIFYESDLILSGIKATQASMFSGVYMQIFNEELTLCNEKMFCFVHLSVQEFFAALYVYLKFNNENLNVLVKKSSASRRFPFRDSSELILYKEAVEKALRCENGHFDIFLRFLLGLSLESNQVLLKHLMTSNKTNQRTRTEIIKHIKERIRASPSPDRCLNLFHCLNELNDRSLVDEIQSYLRSGSLDKAKLSPAQWATLVFVLLTSEEELSVFELSNYTRSEEGLLRLLPVVKTARVANLNACNLTLTCCDMLANSISSSQLRELDLCNNNLTDEGITRLSGGLKNSKLETLRLRSCNLTEHSSDDLASVLSSVSCQLKVLDLSDNDVQDVGVKKLCGGLGSPRCKLEILMLSLCRLTEESCTFLASTLNSSGLKELDLSYNHPGNSGLELLSALQDDPQCSLRKLSVEQCGESRIQPGPRKYTKKLTLDPNTAHRDLSLSEGNRKATRWTKQPYADHPERFDYWTQVLCREGLTGRCYWETEWSGRAFVGVAYRRMCRKGEGHDSWLGKNDSSWGLSCNKDGYKTWHNGMNTALRSPPSSNKVGVYLDWSTGTLSFFSVSCGALTLLHTFHTTFTEPVYPGFWLGWVDSTVYLC
ncbi:NACHT, LRR and PYD domains-containing protein 3-like isoform X2 [Chelmon rostratus]|uniref:NACHT, LRR and PYD domains-containing protein 3-like isoform X2 n=1 Tax=Chelmon rostratus TaxID=109905 RepID=UPI001BEBDFB9|nr:NACHT, LRR and PYD domains-containing protein 3-like isoform X2 [Chelmon rostratus]XP_041819022.1 NACHT, LRR and PYD domains-containing protein 3-like isoform X2 [Chelmon rostratus]XP_041819023.1 NACHT, LRR and PYD domains-containing protein 3-like isoform X2 [Chelmon rostratus]XP_041819024.1 NACHT, LRR and PYD domains-containing protein 3-like isoform X2 [Chelmon rostratus]